MYIILIFLTNNFVYQFNQIKKQKSHIKTIISLIVNLFMEYLLNTNKLIKEIIDALPDNYLRQERDCIPTMFTRTNRTRQQN